MTKLQIFILSILILFFLFIVIYKVINKPIESTNANNSPLVIIINFDHTSVDNKGDIIQTFEAILVNNSIQTYLIRKDLNTLSTSFSMLGQDGTKPAHADIRHVSSRAAPSEPTENDFRKLQPQEHIQLGIGTLSKLEISSKQGIFVNFGPITVSYVPQGQYIATLTYFSGDFDGAAATKILKEEPSLLALPSSVSVSFDIDIPKI